MNLNSLSPPLAHIGQAIRLSPLVVIIAILDPRVISLGETEPRRKPEDDKYNYSLEISIAFTGQLPAASSIILSSSEVYCFLT